MLQHVSDKDAVLPPPPPMPSHSLNFMQFKRAIKVKGSKYFVVNVMVSEEPAAEVAEDGELPEPNCSKRFKVVLDPVVDAFPDVFADLPAGLPPDRGVGLSISTGNSPPVSRPMNRLSPKEKAETERQLTDLLEKDFIKPSKSAWEAPVIFVAKKSGELQICVNHCALDQVTVKGKSSLSRFDDLLDRLQGASVPLDLSSGYHQLRIAEKLMPNSVQKAQRRF